LCCCCGGGCKQTGSLSSAVLLIAGTTVGAGILAIPSVTQESGFLASAVTCVTCWIYMVGTGLLVAEVNVNTMCELGSGGVSLVCFSDFLFLSFPES
jgi:tyrosine-specific transport protein